MKNQINQFGRKLTSISAILLASISVSQAGTGTWLGTTDALWADPNWSGLIPGSGDTAIFNGAGSGNTSIGLGLGITISNIIFDTTSVASYTIGTGAVGSQTLTLNDGGGVQMSSTVANNQIFDANIVLGTTAGAATYAITNSSAASTLTLAGSIAGGAGGAAGTKALTLAGNNITISGNLTNGGTTNLSLAQAGSGTVTLTGANTFSGPVTGITGSLVIGGAGFLGSTNSSAGAITNVYPGAIANNGIFKYNSSANETNTGIMSGSGSLVVNGPGTLTLSTSNTFTGGTTVNGGLLALRSGGNVGALASGVLTINQGGTVNTYNLDSTGTISGTSVTTINVVGGTFNDASGTNEGLITCWNLTGGTVAAILGTNGAYGAINFNTNQFLPGPTYTNLNTFASSVSSVFSAPASLRGTGGLVCTVALGTVPNGVDLLVSGPISAGTGGTGVIKKSGAGYLSLTATNTFNGGIIVSNGTLSVDAGGRLNSGNFAGAITNLATFNYHSSSIQALTGAITNAGTMNFTGTGYVVVSGVVTNAGVINFNSPALQAMEGRISGSGSLNQNGAGVVMLYGANTYTGLTTVNAGSLIVASTQPNTSAVTVNDGGTLGVTATTGGTSGFSPSTLILGSSAGASVQLTLNSTTQAPLTPGVLNLVGNSTIYITAASTLVANQQYPLLSYSSSSGSGTLGFSLPAGVLGNVSKNGNLYTLTVMSVTVVPATTWTSAVNGTWDINTTANWITGGVPGKYVDGSPVLFDEVDNTGHIFLITNQLGAGPLSPGSIVFDNSANNYTLSNSVVIAGITGVTMNGTGFVTNKSTNIYTGPTLINSGSLVAGAASTALGGPFGINSAVSLANVAGATLNLNSNATFIGSLSGGGGSGGNVTNGTGTLTLGSDNSSQVYGGAIGNGSGGLTLIGSGSLTLTNPYNNFTGSSTIGLLNTLTIGNAGLLGGGTYAGNIANNGVFNFNSSANQILSGVMSGAGVLNDNGTGILNLANNNTFTGAANVNNGATVILSAGGGAGALRGALNVNLGGTVTATIADSIGYTAGQSVTTLNLNGGTFNNNSGANEGYITGFNLTGGTVNSTSTAYINFNTGYGISNFASSTLSVFNAPISIRGTGMPFTVAQGTVPGGVDLVVTANIKGGSYVTLTGPGTLEFTGGNSYTGATIINSGTLMLGGGGNLGSGLYSYPITNNGTFLFAAANSQYVSGVIYGTGSVVVSNTPSSGSALVLTQPESYSGPTLISAGTLQLSGSASINLTPSITTSNGGIFDVSQLNSSFILGSAQTLSGYGNVVGPVTTSPGSKIYAGTDLGYGTLTFNNNLTMVQGATFNLDVGATAGGPNDLLVVNGGLTVISNVIHLKAPSTTAPLDISGASYTLISSPGGIAGTFSPAPSWDVLPSNPGNYSIVSGPTSVSLVYSTIAGPSFSSATASPPTVARNQTVMLSVTITPGQGTVTNVSVDVSTLGGSATTPMVLSGVPNVYTNSISIAPSVAVGSYFLTVLATDNTPRSGSVAITLTVAPSTETWAGGGANENFDTAANWLSGLAPGYVGDSVVFGGTGGTAGPNPNLDNNYTLAGLTYNTGSTFVIASGNGSTLGLSGGVTNNSGNPVSLNVPISLAAPVTFNTTNGNINIGGAVSGNAGALIAIGTNNLTLSSLNNTFSGPVTVRQGTTTVSGSIAPNNQIFVSDTTTSNATLSIASTGSVIDLSTLGGQGGGTIIVGKATNAAGVLTMSSGGNLTTGEELDLGYGGGGYADFEMSGGTANIGSYLVVGFNTDHAQFDMSGGTVNILTNVMTIASGGTASVGVVNISGGTFSATDISYGLAGAQGGLYVGEYGNGTLNVSGNATVNVYGLTNLTLARNSGAAGMVNLLGGTIYTGQVAGGAGTSTFNFNGGKLLNNASYQSGTFLSGITRAYIYGGGATIDDGGGTIYISNPLLAPAGYGVSSITVTNGGSGYIAPPVVTITGGAGTGASAIARVSGGSVTSVQIVNPGSGYASSDVLTVGFSGGGVTPINGSVAGASAPLLSLNASGGLTKTSLSGSGSGSLVLTGASTYTNVTTISSGSLQLSGGGSISGSAGINLAGSTTFFDVSALPGGLVLGTNQFLEGTGDVNGLVTTSSGSRIIPGTDGTYGTLTFFSGLALGNGTTASFDLNTSTSGANDKVVVSGGLSLVNNVIHVKAPSTSVNMGTSDYVLFSVSGGIQGYPSSVPIFDVAPLNASDYHVTISGNTVVLRYSTLAAPTGTGSASPSSGIRNEPVTFSVTVTSSSAAIASVIVDTSPLGGSLLYLNRVNSSATYTNGIILPAAAAPGLYSLTAVITDNNNLSTTISIPFTVVTTTETWNGLDAAINPSWDDNVNWASGAAPGLIGDSLIFDGSRGLAPIIENNNYTVSSLTFSSTAGQFNIGGGQTLTVVNGVTNNSANVETLNMPVAVGGTTTTLNAASGNLVLDQSIGGTGSLVLTGPGTVTLSGTANTLSGSTTINSSALIIGGAGQWYNSLYTGAIADNSVLDFNSSGIETNTGVISGAGALVVNGSGVLTLSAINTFTGGTTVNNGATLALNNGGASGCIRGNLTINQGGTVSAYVTDTVGYGAAATSVSNIYIYGGTFNNFSFANEGYSLGWNLTGATVASTGGLINFNTGYGVTNFATNVTTVWSAAIAVRSTTGLTFTVAKGTVPTGVDINVSGNIGTGAYSFPTASINMAGNGTMVVSGENTILGGAQFLGGTMNLGSAETPGTYGPLGVGGPIVFGGGIMQYSSANQFDYSSRFSTAPGQPIMIDTGGQPVSFGTALVGAGTSLTKLGLGTLSLAPGETYTGPTIVSNGTLALVDGSLLANSSGIVIAGGATLDTTAVASFTLGANVSLTASGTAAAPAAIAGGGTISFGSSPIILNYDGVGPALTIASGSLSLAGNAFTVNGSPLTAGSHLLVQQASGTITGSGNFTVQGTAVGPGALGSITVNGGQVFLNISIPTSPTLGFNASANVMTFTWPSDHLGFILQSNSINVGVEGDWVNIPGTAAVTATNLNINTLRTNVFFRLIAP